MSNKKSFLMLAIALIIALVGFIQLQSAYAVPAPCGVVCGDCDPPPPVQCWFGRTMSCAEYCVK